MDCLPPSQSYKTQYSLTLNLPHGRTILLTGHSLFCWDSWEKQNSNIYVRLCYYEKKLIETARGSLPVCATQWLAHLPGRDRENWVLVPPALILYTKPSSVNKKTLIKGRADVTNGEKNSRSSKFLSIRIKLHILYSLNSLQCWINQPTFSAWGAYSLKMGLLPAERCCWLARLQFEDWCLEERSQKESKPMVILRGATKTVQFSRRPNFCLLWALWAQEDLGSHCNTLSSLGHCFQTKLCLFIVLTMILYITHAC